MYARTLFAAATSLAFISQLHAMGLETVTEQSGSNNSAQIEQLGGTYVWTHLVQTGDLNETEVSQLGLNVRMEAIQHGTANVLSTDQEGFGNWIVSRQEGDRNSQRVDQRSDGGAEAYITQVGVNHSLSITQEGDYHNVTADQAGQDNTLQLVQTFMLSGLTATQNGTGNRADVSQGGMVGAQIEQDGQGNTLDFSQGAFAHADATIRQIGQSNGATVRQYDGGYFGGSTLELTQDGVNNRADLDITVAQGSFEYLQTGTGNDLRVNQTGSPIYGQPTEKRGGRISGHSTGNYNTVDIVQGGDGNSLDLAQAGDGNVIVAIQASVESDGDSGLIRQVGNSNYVALDQSVIGSGGTANVLQNGTTNSAIILQR
jgi:hypothetical protein